MTERVRRAAQAGGRSMNEYVTAVLDEANKPDLAGDETAARRERLARAGRSAAAAEGLAALPPPVSPAGREGDR
ncbi:MAG: hypothetical protein ACR2KK_13800 [Acidimicrobiales bacterium]